MKKSLQVGSKSIKNCWRSIQKDDYIFYWPKSFFFGKIGPNYFCTIFYKNVFSKVKIGNNLRAADRENHTLGGKWWMAELNETCYIGQLWWNKI